MRHARASRSISGMNIADLARLLENIVRFGTIEAVQMQPPRVQVKSGNITTATVFRCGSGFQPVTEDEFDSGWRKDHTKMPGPRRRGDGCLGQNSPNYADWKGFSRGFDGRREGGGKCPLGWGW